MDRNSIYLLHTHTHTHTVATELCTRQKTHEYDNKRKTDRQRAAVGTSSGSDKS